VLARSQVTILDASAQIALFLGGEQRDFVDLLEIGLQASFGGNGRLLGGDSVLGRWEQRMAARRGRPWIGPPERPP
jgi:hypothetical protein